jgi:hypothetical protein
LAQKEFSWSDEIRIQEKAFGAFLVVELNTAAKKLDILGHFIIGAYIIRIEQ